MVPEMKNETNIWGDAYSRMDMACAAVMGSVAASVFWAVCILLGVI